MKKGNEIREEFRNWFQDLVAFSDTISLDYDALNEIELKFGTNSKEYKELKGIIEKYVVRENNELDFIFSHISTSIAFKKYLEEHPCKRIMDRMENYYNQAESFLFITINNEYTELSNNGYAKVSREEYVDSNYKKRSKDLLLNIIFCLLHFKKNIMLCDYFINNTDSQRLKSFLICTKNDILKNNRFLEEWYFKFEENSLDGFLSESDSLIAQLLEIPLDSFLELKDIHFVVEVNDFLTLIVDGKDSLNSEEIVIYQLNALAALLNMSANCVNESYLEFIEDLESYDCESLDRVDEIYSQLTNVSKQLRLKYPKEEEV